MLPLVMVMMVISTTVVVANRRDVLSLYLSGLCASFVVMMVGVITYIAKMGGYDEAKQLFLFLLPSLQKWLQNLPLRLGVLGYTVALGRCFFPMYLVFIAIYHTNIHLVRRHERVLRQVHLGITVLFLVYYFPPVFRFVVGGKFWVLVLMRRVSLGWIVLCVAEALALLVQEYIATTSPYFKRTQQLVLLAMLSITGLYSMYAVQDPGQIYNFYVSEYIRLGSLNYLMSALSSWVGWLLLAAATIFFVGFGTLNLVSFSRLGQSEQQEEMILQRKFDTASMGASVFVHSIKNQLLSARVVHKKLGQELAKPQPEMDRVREYAALLSGMNETMLARMEELYRSIKVNYISLVPVDSSQLVEAALGRLHQKYPDQTIWVDQQTHALVLADSTHMAEAIYNLLVNAVEAVNAAGRADIGRVELRVRGERLWLDFEVSDNGTGLSRSAQKKIFDPFYTSKNTNYNWGMGLYYVRQITRSHLGHLQIHSTEGKGSTFSIMLPRYVPNQNKNARDRRTGS